MAQVYSHDSPLVPVGNVAENSDASTVFMSTSLYIGDLDVNVDDTQLIDFFRQVGQVVSVRVCKDMSTGRSLGYGYVNYSTTEGAERALEELNFTPLNGKPIRIMYSYRDPTIRKSGAGNIFIKNLEKEIDNKALHDTFSTFGNILSCKIATDQMGQSKGYGFVQFDNEESAKSAIDNLNGMLINDKPVYVGPFLRKQERESGPEKERFNNVFVKNISESTTNEELMNIFGEYGTIASVVVMRDVDGKSKCFGFVNFENPEDAAKSIESLNGKKIDNKEWYVGKAQTKSERQLEFKGKLHQGLKETVDKFEGMNLYVKNLDDSITDDKLRELFTAFGTVTSCKVMRATSGISKGSGFVAFSTTEEASRALMDMNGKMVASKPLYVALAQRKEERRARLQAQFSHMRPAIAPPVAPHMPMYPSGAPGLGQQMFYGQGRPAIIPPQPGMGYQRQLVAGIRPNFFVPLIQPGQQSQRPGGRSGAIHRQPHPLMQPQMLPRGRVYQYPPSRNMHNVHAAGVPVGMFPVPCDVGGIPFRDASFPQSMTTGALYTALANASPQQQRILLGENLYPLVEQLEYENTAKVTGMLLEMDQPEVLHLLESPESLKAKVAEAQKVLRIVALQQQQVDSPTERMASLSLNDNLVS